jgi:hypothetical protein
MTTPEQHPITPPPELRCQWQSESPFKVISVEREDYMIDLASRWGADQELEACCEWFQEFYKTESWGKRDLEHFRAARRPKPPSLKERALSETAAAVAVGNITPELGAIIRLALEALPND